MALKNTDMDLTEEIRATMARAFVVDEDDIPDDASQETYPRWSSLSHMILVSSLEEQYGVRLSMKEMNSMTSLPRIIEVLTAHGAPGAESRRG